MREQPTGESLLQCARDVLKNNVLPMLQGDAKRDVLMVMNAMSIAQRELQQGTALMSANSKRWPSCWGNLCLMWRRPIVNLRLAFVPVLLTLKAPSVQRC